jgi:hypothetical protein
MNPHLPSFQPSGALAQRELEPRFLSTTKSISAKAGFQIACKKAGVWNDGFVGFRFAQQPKFSN